MRVLLSIKPEYANRIFAGSKLFEFRKTLFRNPVTTVVVYASAPVSKVVGEFEVEELLEDDLASLWQRTKDHAGISEEFFYSYFGKRTQGCAIKVKNPLTYEQPRALEEVYSSRPPQSFAYLGG